MLEAGASGEPMSWRGLKRPESSGAGRWAELEVFQRKAEFDAWLAESGAAELSVQPLERSVVESGNLVAWCPACQHEHRMRFSAGRPNLREEMACDGCGFNARTRAVIDLLGRLQPSANDRIHVTEQISPLYRWLKARYRRLQGSEFVGPGRFARLKAKARHLLRHAEFLHIEDVTGLSFADGSRNFLICCDVLEHVPEYRLALTEFARVLRPSGWLVLTVPFLAHAAETLVRARITSEGQLEHLVEPEYHGDTVSRDGILAFHTFSWDLLDRVREAGFEEAAWCMSRGLELGLPGPQWTLLARR